MSTIATNNTQQSGGVYRILADGAHTDERTHVLNHCNSFAILNRSGDIHPLGKEVQGIYHKDTRYIHLLDLTIGAKRPTLLSSNIKEENEILSVDLANPSIFLDDGQQLESSAIHLHRSQFLRHDTFHEKITITSYHDRDCTVPLTLVVGADFRDIFEVRGQQRKARGTLEGIRCDQQAVHIAYLGLDQVHRASHIHFSVPFDYKQSEDYCEVIFPLRLAPLDQCTVEYVISFEENHKTNPKGDYQNAKNNAASDIEKTKTYFPVIDTSNEQFTHWINRSQADLVSLMADTPTGKYPYAGVPWYNTAFGRDGIITALETLWAVPRLAKDVLLFLAAHQATTYDEQKDAEPGKILHETRGGEMVALNEVPFKQYYGTIDATPLFVMLAGEYYERTHDLETIQKIWPNIEKAIGWMDTYGDIDGDGFIEYQHKSVNGLTNQGWKDSYDAVFYHTGKLAEAPIALCEVQGYAYSARQHAAQLASVLGHTREAQQWQQQAASLKQKFNEVFWDKDMQCYVLALDKHKKPCRVKSSNAGQVLYTRIADADKAEQLIRTLLAPDMYTGWGIRTLSNTEKRYNPMSYHNGSVWPHDVALIAEGMGRYGYQQQARQLLTGLFDASLFMDLQRLPELFCGMDRRKGEGPTAYPVACSPQAWSVAAVYMLLKAILQIEIAPARKEIYFHKPILPAYLERVSIRQLDIGQQRIDLDLTRHGQDNMIGIHWNYTGSDWQLCVVK